MKTVETSEMNNRTAMGARAKAPYEPPRVEESAEFEAFCVPCAPFAPGECTFPQGAS